MLGEGVLRCVSEGVLRCVRVKVADMCVSGRVC